MQELVQSRRRPWWRIVLAIACVAIVGILATVWYVGIEASPSTEQAKPPYSQVDDERFSQLKELLPGARKLPEHLLRELLYADGTLELPPPSTARGRILRARRQGAERLLWVELRGSITTDLVTLLKENQGTWSPEDLQRGQITVLIAVERLLIVAESPDVIAIEESGYRNIREKRFVNR